MKKPHPAAAKPLNGTLEEVRDVPSGAARNTVTTQASQSESFDSAMQYFHKRDFAAAKKLFEKAAAGPSREMTHTAKLHIRMCDQRLNQNKSDVRSAEDLYHYAVSLINRRQLGEAEQNLRKALEQSPNADHIHYALGLACGLQGKAEDAARHLARSIQLEPKNRIVARNDPDFLEFGRQGPAREIVFSESKESS